MESNQRALVGTLAVVTAAAAAVLVLAPSPLTPPCVEADYVDVKVTALDPAGKTGTVNLSADPVSFGGKKVGVKWRLVNGVNPRTQLSFTSDGITIVSGALQGRSRGHRISSTEYLVCFDGRQPAQAQGNYHVKFISVLDAQETKWNCDPTIINDHMRGDGEPAKKACTAP